jgi:hypothetical protein
MTPREDFWSWFAKQESELFDFDPLREAERERLFDELASELKKVDPDLAFEFDPRDTRTVVGILQVRERPARPFCYDCRRVVFEKLVLKTPKWLCASVLVKWTVPI